jgi:hypothetical protein
VTDVTGATISGAVLGLVAALMAQQLGFVALTGIVWTLLVLGAGALLGGLVVGLIALSVRR